LQHYHAKSGRPRKDAPPQQCYYHIRATVVPKALAIATQKQRAGRLILATNVLDAHALSNDDLLREYKAQQSTSVVFVFSKTLDFLPAVFSSTLQNASLP